LLVRNLGSGVYITHTDGTILDSNPALLELLGIPSLEALESYRAQDLMVDPEQRGRELARLHDGDLITEYEFQVRRPSDGEIRTLLDTCYAVRDPDTGDLHFMGILVDITERKELEDRLEQLTIRDPLTGCYNRRHLSQVSEDLSASSETWGVVVFDLDHFKTYNDLLGHRAGDQALVKVSRLLMRHVRAEDSVVRMGGDEFLLVLPDATDKVTAAVALRLETRGAEPGGVPFSLGWSHRIPGEPLEATIHRADRHLLERRAATRRMEPSADPERPADP
jgi:diguanylate cyclase (GGDEF)-like protein/PAS domain S-box-containing protein